MRIRELERPIFEHLPDAGKIVGLRNIIINGYDAIDPSILWAIAEERLGELGSRLAELIEEAQKQGL